MILRGLHLEHWRCIRRLDLDGLPDGIVVLHGPNRTGKSSLVRALRSCLFDANHNTSSKEIKACLPFNGAGPPRVSVEFATGGVDYRLTKVFSTRKEGTALLEKCVAGSWKAVETAPMEAARQARMLLGADNSHAGVQQLLWLEQGDVQLPATLDPALGQRLTQVLGSLVTGRDFAFHEEIKKRSAVWFTARGSDYRKGSPVRNWEQRREERRRQRDEELAKSHDLEAALRQMEGLEDEEPRLKKAADAAARDLALVEQERGHAQDRLRENAESARAVVAARQALDQAEARLAGYEEARRRQQDRENAVGAAQTRATAAQETRDRLHRNHLESVQALQQVRQEEETHRRGQEEIDDLRRLLELTQSLAQLDESIALNDQLNAEIAKLQERIGATAVPDEQRLIQLRADRTTAETLRARLQASALTLRIVPRRPGSIEVRLDGQPARPIELQPGQARTWELRQRTALDIPDFGTIELARSRDDLDLERAARDLAELDRSFADVVGSFQEDPADAACLDRLAQRRYEGDAWAKRLDDARRELANKCPEGRGALEARRNAMVSQRQQVLQRRPTAQTTADDVETRTNAFRSRATQLEARRKECEAAEKKSQAMLQQAEAHLQNAKLVVAQVEATARAGREELARLGDEAALQAAVEQSRQNLDAAQREVDTTRLTEAEITVEDRFAAGKRALDQHGQRLQEVRERLSEFRGVLRGNEGLHLRLADAEASLAEAETQFVREKLEADAHRRLLDLFEECRESQVQSVMDPVAGRVLDWARQIGLEDYDAIPFGDRSLPQGIRRNSDEDLLALEEESYGTGEQLSLLVRLALGGVLAEDEPAVAILDDPLAHADPARHRQILEILRLAAEGNAALVPPAGRLQIVILTCHHERFAHLPGATYIDLAARIEREV